MVLCSPSLGILDNWLPVLSELRTRHPQWSFTVVVARHSSIRLADMDDVVIGMCDEVFDGVVFQSQRGLWRWAPSFSAAHRDLATQRRVGRLGRILEAFVPGRIRRWRWWGEPAVTLTRMLAASLAGAWVDMRAIVGPESILCYDVYVSDKDDTRHLLRQWPEIPRFSLLHGINVREVPSELKGSVEAPTTIAYLYSPRERDAYAAWYGIESTRARVVGVPRHESAWMQQVIEASKRRHPDPPDGSVFLISRPAGTPYLPRERRRSALRDIYRVVCEEFGLHLVVKLHPKERDNGDFEHVFPSGSRGQSWSHSRAHPFHLGSASLFAVSFLSGVAIDMIVLGVPTIERLDVRGIPNFDNPAAVRDDRGRPMLSYFRRNGLVLPADDEADIRAQTERILADRDGVVADLRAAYRSTFSDPRGAISRIASDLELT